MGPSSEAEAGAGATLGPVAHIRQKAIEVREIDKRANLEFSVESLRMKDAESIAQAMYEAYVRKDRAAIERLIDNDFHFTSPLDNRIDRSTYFERCWPNSQRISDFRFINVVPHEDKVFVTYEGTNVNGDRFRNTEVLTVQRQKVVEVEVYFGRSIPHPAPTGGFTSA